jgi:phosphoserine phosphatase RsbU/P
MATPSQTMTRADGSELDKLRELIDAYAGAHGAEVWFWERVDDVWGVSVGTIPPPHDAPGPSAATVPRLMGPPAFVEVAGHPDPMQAASFLALVLAGFFAHQNEARFFGREIAERYEEITLLYTISEVLGSVISLEKAASTILREVADTLGVQRAALWIHEAEFDALRLVASVGEEGQADAVRVDDETSITAAVFRDRHPMILEPGDVYPRKETGNAESNRDSFLAVPVSYTPPHGETRTIGVINLIGRRVEEGFSAGDRKLITAIASQIGAAVENSRLVAESLRQERMDREMELAHNLQLKLLPDAERFRDRAEVAAQCSPADSVGGDFYHLFRLPGDRLGVVIGDVSSHGFGAALIMALTMSAIGIHASEGDPPAEVLRRVHQALIDELENTEMYLTLFYGVIDPDRGEIVYVNAGHSHAFRITEAGEAIRLGATSPPMGMVDGDGYAEATAPWSPGADLLLLFTDGLSDALGAGEIQGEKMLVDETVRGRTLATRELLDRLFMLTGDHTDVPADDRTAVLVRI